MSLSLVKVHRPCLPDQQGHFICLHLDRAKGARGCFLAWALGVRTLARGASASPRSTADYQPFPVTRSPSINWVCGAEGSCTLLAASSAALIFGRRSCVLHLTTPPPHVKVLFPGYSIQGRILIRQRFSKRLFLRRGPLFLGHNLRPGQFIRAFPEAPTSGDTLWGGQDSNLLCIHLRLALIRCV